MTCMQDCHEPIRVFNGTLAKQDLSAATSIIGEVIYSEHSVTFIPLISFGTDHSYTALFKDELYHFEIEISEEYEYLEVEKIYPSGPELPANLLKIYVKFSKPISPAKVFDHILILDEHEIAVERAVLELENPLLSGDGTLLTLWIEPGRQKRGLGPNLMLGPVFTEGRSYQIQVSESLKDLNGVPMKKRGMHYFKIIKDDRKKIDASKWQIDKPDIETFQDLIITCGETLDFGSALSGISILNNKDEVVEGTWHFAEHETKLIFSSVNIWSAGSYTLVIDHVVEDLAGNNLVRLFDQPIGMNEPQPSTAEFTIQIKIE